MSGRNSQVDSGVTTWCLGRQIHDSDSGGKYNFSKHILGFKFGLTLGNREIFFFQSSLYDSPATTARPCVRVPAVKIRAKSLHYKL